MMVSGFREREHCYTVRGFDERRSTVNGESSASGANWICIARLETSCA